MAGANFSRLLITTALATAECVAPSFMTPVGMGGAKAAQTLTLDEITILVTLMRQRAIDALAGVSARQDEEISENLPSRIEDILIGLPGVLPSSNVDDPAVGFNIRGLQEYGRVAVLIDGARQNFEVAQHGPQGKIYLDPELLSEVQVARGPVTNINGTGAIGGVVSLRTKEAADILADDERFGAVFDGIAGTNAGPFVGSVFLAARPTTDFDVTAGISARHSGDYKDGNGDVVADSGYDQVSGLFKASVRPSEGQQLKLGTTFQQTNFVSGVSPEYAAVYGSSFLSNYANTVNTSTVTGEYTFDSPDNPLINFFANAYWNHGDARTETIKEDDFGGMFTKELGAWSGYKLDTLGFSTHNASEFDAAGLQHILTLGVDAFTDIVDSAGSSSDPDAGYNLTISGDRRVYGAFAQWEAKYGTFLDVIGGLRFDGYDAKGNSFEGSGERLSPKLTVGITPAEGLTLYGTYAEGYRVPSTNEAFVSGYHPGYIFTFLPNPSLRPEIGHTLEAGINIERAGILREDDKLTFKGNVFQNNVTDYIDTVGSSCGSMGCAYYTYANLPSARIRGVEVEGKYDAGRWFADASAALLDSVNNDTGDPLLSVLPFQAYASIGARFLDDRLTIAPNVRFFSASSDGTSYAGYQLLGLNVSYQPNENTTASLVLDNILNEQYTPLLSNNYGAGFTAKASLKVKLAAN